jgi:hypothetical protein
MLKNNNQRLEDIICAKEGKIITLYDLFVSFVPSQAGDITIEPKKYDTVYDRDRWNNLLSNIEINRDSKNRKKMSQFC